jgi:hypothetical protein
VIPNSPYRLETFQEKTQPGLDGTVKDISELTLLNQKTGRKVVLPLGVVVNSPESHAVIRYLWAPFGEQPVVDGKASAVMQKRRDDEFSLPPEMERKYRVLDIRADEVDVRLPSGETHTLRKAG